MHEGIVEAIAEITGKVARIGSIRSVGGGSINACFVVDAEGETLFVKSNHPERYPFMFEREEDGLRLFREQSSFTVPETHGVHYGGDAVYLVMEFLQKGRPKGDFSRRFAESLVGLHSHSWECFGLDLDNYIGSLPQWNDACESWTDFFIQQRLDPLVEKAYGSGLLDRDDLSAFQRLYGHLDDFFPSEAPSLLHGDLWSGNYMAVENGSPGIFDPAVYYGHRYMDLGMMQLFGGFDQEIFSIYDELHPLPSNWRKGTEVANLYPLLVHVILFGASYVPQVRSVLSSHA